MHPRLPPVRPGPLIRTLVATVVAAVAGGAVLLGLGVLAAHQQQNLANVGANTLLFAPIGAWVVTVYWTDFNADRPPAMRYVATALMTIASIAGVFCAYDFGAWYQARYGTATSAVVVFPDRRCEVSASRPGCEFPRVSDAATGRDLGRVDPCLAYSDREFRPGERIIVNADPSGWFAAVPAECEPVTGRATYIAAGAVLSALGLRAATGYWSLNRRRRPIIGFRMVPDHARATDAPTAKPDDSSTP
jgi:hypothetical protein